MKKPIFNLLFSFLVLVFAASPVLAAEFDPNYIISDAELLDNTAMSLGEIDLFLKSYGGYISKHSFTDSDGVARSAAEIIYNAANNYDCDDIDLSDNPSRSERVSKCPPARVNPKLLLVLLQKEMSLIEETAPKQSQLDWATGYGCPDGGGCNPRWKSFGKQVNSAGLQFYDYMMNPQDYPYRKGQAYTVSNTGRPDSVIRPINDATAALYNYTPHVYNGNYNFWNLWRKYFNKAYGNNTLLQAKGETGVWLIQNGIRRPFLTKGAMTSRFDPDKIIQVSSSDLEKYPIGDPIKFPQYSLVRSPRGTVFLLVDDKRRGFASGEALRQVGINPEEIIDADWDDINVYAEGEPITVQSAYPAGALLQDKTTGGIYYVSDNTKAPLWDPVLLQTRFRNMAIIPESPEKLAQYETIEPAKYEDGELLKSAASPAVYVIDRGQKRPFTSGVVFESLGYKWGNVITVPDKIMDLYPEGEPVSQVYVDEDSGDKAEETEALTQEEIEEMME